MQYYATEGAGAMAASKKIADAVQGNTDYYIKWMANSQRTMCSYNAIIPSVLLSVLPGGMALWLSGSLDTMTFMAEVIFSLGLVGSIMEAFSFTDSLAMLGKNTAEIDNILSAEELHHADKPVTLGGLEINLTDVSFSYDKQQEVLHGIDLSIFFSFLNGIFASFQFGALYFTVDALASGNHSLTSVWLSLGMMVISIAGQIFASFFSMNEQTVTEYGMVADKRISIGDRPRYIPMGYFNKNNIGTITGIVTTTLGDAGGSAPVALVNMIGGFFNSAVLILFLLIFNWQLGAFALVGVSCYLLVTKTATRKSTSTAEKSQNTQRELVEAVLDIQGMGVVKSFGFEKDRSKSIAAAIRDNNKGNLKLVYAVDSFIALQQLVIRVFSVLLLMLTIYLYSVGNFSFVYGVLFVILSFTIFNNLESAGSQIAMLQMLFVY